MYSNNGYGNGQSSFYPGDVGTPTLSNLFISLYAQDVLGAPVSSNVPDYHVSSHPPSPAVPAPALTRAQTGTTQLTVIRSNKIPAVPPPQSASLPTLPLPQYPTLCPH